MQTYCTTEEIHRVANKTLLANKLDDMNGSVESLSGGTSNRHGEQPEIFVAKTFSQECDWIVSRIKEVQDALNVKLCEICIVTQI